MEVWSIPFNDHVFMAYNYEAQDQLENCIEFARRHAHTAPQNDPLFISRSLVYEAFLKYGRGSPEFDVARTYHNAVFHDDQFLPFWRVPDTIPLDKVKAERTIHEPEELPF